MPNSQIRNSVPSSRVSAFQTGKTGEPRISIGMPIGLLLSLTYAEALDISSFGDFRPTSRISNQITNNRIYNI